MFRKPVVPSVLLDPSGEAQKFLFSAGAEGGGSEETSSHPGSSEGSGHPKEFVQRVSSMFLLIKKIRKYSFNGLEFLFFVSFCFVFC